MGRIMRAIWSVINRFTQSSPINNDIVLSDSTIEKNTCKTKFPEGQEIPYNLTDILESISDAFVSLDNNWCYTYMNKKAGEIFNRNTDEIIGKHIWTEFPEGVGQVFYHAYQKAIETQEVQYLEEYYEPYDLWFENRIYPSKKGLSIFFHDITKSKKAEEKIRINEARLKKGQEIGHFGYWQQEIGSNIVWASGEAKRIYGFEPVPGELSKHLITKCINNVDVLRQATIDLIEKDKNYNIEFSIMPADGSSQKIVSAVAELERDAKGKPLRLMGVVQDITERKKFEEALAESETYNRKLFDQSAIGLAVTKVDGLLVDINPAFAKIIGRSIEECKQLSYWEITPEKFAKQEQLQIESLKKHGFYGPYEKEYIHKDGHLVPVRLQGLTIERKSEKLIWSSVEDITTSKQVEKALRTSEEHFRTLFEHAPYGIFITNPDGNYIEVNQKGTSMLGYTQEELKGKHISDIVVESDKGRINPEFEEVKSKVQYNREWEFKRKDNSVFFGDLMGAILPDNNVLGILNDITERKLAEEEIRTTNDELKTINRVIVTSTSTSDLQVLLNKILDEALQIVDLEGGSICLSESDNTLKLVAQREVTNKSLITNKNKLIKVGECLCRNCSKDHCSSVLFDQKTISKHSVHKVLSGDKINFHASYPFISKDKCLGVLCVFTRTQKKPSERSIKLLESLSAQISLAIENAKLFNELEQRVKERTAQLTDANKELESFSYSISHDLRAPLRAIYGFSQILAKRHNSSLNEEGSQYMGYIVESSIRMEQLINDLLSYSRLGRKSLEIHSISFEKILDGIYSDFEKQLKDVNGKLIIPQKLPHIHSDETLIRQIFTNLIDNAINYRRTDTKLEITIGFEETNQGYLIRISDNGIGIPQEHWKKIFNVFQRLHGEDKYPGTGIGLANVEKAVTMLGGSVNVESIVGTGSTFFIKLPEYKI